MFYTKFLIICRIFLKVQLKINIDKDLVISIASDCLLQHILSPCIHDRISSHNQRGILISSHRHRLYVSRCLDISHFSTIYNYLDIFSECASALCVHIFKRQTTILVKKNLHSWDHLSVLRKDYSQRSVLRLNGTSNLFQKVRRLCFIVPLT